MMCLSSLCEHCKRIISTNKYARFDRRVTQRSQHPRQACRAHTIARPLQPAQTHTSANRDGKDATSLRLPHISARISARTTHEAGGTVRKLARSASADPQSAKHSSALRGVTPALRNDAPPSLLLLAADRARRQVLRAHAKEEPPALGPLPQPPEQPCSLSAVQLRACANGGDKSSIFAARMAGRASGGGARIPSCGA